jgi:hypothetical protein
VTDHVAVWELDEDGRSTYPDGNSYADIARLQYGYFCHLRTQLVGGHGWDPKEPALDKLEITLANAVGDALRTHAIAKHHNPTQIQGETAILSLDGRSLVCVTRTDVAKNLLGRPDLTAKECICVWDLEARHIRHLLRCGRPLEWAGVSPDSKTLVYCCADGSIGFWDLEKGACQDTTQVKVSYASLLEGLFSPDSKYFATRVGPDNRRFSPYELIDKESRGSGGAGYTTAYYFKTRIAQYISTNSQQDG